jgi:hypothetical protein
MRLVSGKALHGGVKVVRVWAGVQIAGETFCCSKIAEAEAAVSVNEKKLSVMHMHVQLKLDELRGPTTLGSL